MLNQHQTIKDNIAKFNKPNPLAEYLIPLVGEKKHVSILDVGSGPYSIIGSELEGVEVDLFLCDNQDFSSFWDKYKAKPFFQVSREDMEHLTSVDDYFDIVHSANALDHTKDIQAAVKEMIRVCKPGGWVYIDCHLDQMDTGHKHYWNAKEDGTFVNESTWFDLKAFGFTVRFIDNGGESRYNRIVAILKK